MTEKEPVRVTDEGVLKSAGIYLPVPELGEELTHLACPECEYGEVPLKKSDYYQCDSCHEVYYMRLEKAEHIKEIFEERNEESQEFVPLEEIDTDDNSG